MSTDGGSAREDARSSRATPRDRREYFSKHRRSLGQLDQHFFTVVDPKTTGFSRRSRGLNHPPEREGEARIRRPEQGRLVRKPVQRLDDPGRERLEDGEHLPTDPHPHETCVQVRRILEDLQSMPVDVELDVGAPCSEQRSKSRTFKHGEHPEGGERRPSEQTKEDGLGAVVSGVSGRDDVGAYPRALRVEQSVASLASARLKVGPREHASCEHLAGNVDLRGDREDALDLGLRLGAEPVIDDRRVEFEPEFATEAG
jgi:hypothetical protein